MDSTSPLVPLPPNSKPKLPIKRKTLHSSNNNPTLSPNPNPNPNPNTNTNNHNSSSPFKFHRIWTEPDEIRFLQGLLDSASQGLVFPKHLDIFYHRFSTATCHPYTKSQLSEKLRRLRNKFRAVSSRILGGLDIAALSPHNRAMYDLSRKLWSAEFASVSPFVEVKSSHGKGIGDSGRVRVEEDDGRIRVDRENPNQSERCDGGGNEKVSSGFGGGKIDGVASKIVLDVFDECVEDAKKDVSLWHGVLCGDMNFRRRWQEQRSLELDVFVKRLRLVIEDSLNQHSAFQLMC
ncbi:PREDICTED: probable transcription factor At5g28040 [Lupinus angustifolius]|uniref:probable transcription factor At5g28040 n=1 Tax=Lupinus angustifolius TaxID=3871 RepID=UPI00092EF3F3|nr:PREDICTED: probable transcription factor At5g28040 [Lupinus angustifolius]